MVLCSHKKNALNFLDQLSSVYQQKYILTSPMGVDGTQAFIDEICKLAESNGLPSESFRSSLSEFSADEVRSHLSEVLLLAAFPFSKLNISLSVTFFIVQ